MSQKPRAPINTPAKFTAAREELRLTKAGLARTLRLGEKGGEKTIRRIEQGQDVPGPYQVAMEAMLNGFRPRGFGK